MATRTTEKPVLPDSAITPEEEKAARMLQIRERFDILSKQWSAIHEEAKDDDKFVAGDQWGEKQRQEREEDGRPALTFNMLERYVSTITNQVRMNWPSMKVLPVEADKNNKDQRFSNLAGTKDFSQAEVLNGIIKNIEHTSKADQAYDTAVEHSTRHGFGFFRIVTEYTSDATFDQTIKIKRVKNSYQVLIDLTGEDADYCDSNDGFVFSRMAKDTFEKKWPKARSTAAFSTTGMFYDSWYGSDDILIAEYYYIDYIDDELLLLSDGSMNYRSELKPILDELEENQGITILKARKVKRRQCKWQKMTADEVLEGPIDIPCSYIPIFLVAGKEYIVDDEYQLHSAIRQAKDPQKSYNYNRTAATEKIGLDPKAPYIGTEEQFEGHPEWDQANRKNLPYLTYTHVDGVNPPSRNYPSNAGQMEMANAQMDKMDIREIIGMPEASTGDQSNEISGRAVQARQTAGNLANFTFPDNLNRAVEHACRVLLEMIPKVITTYRVQRIYLEDGTEDFVKLNELITDEETGKEVVKHDIGLGQFDVREQTGANYETRRQEATESMIKILNVLTPEKADAIAHMIVKNMDFPGANEVYQLLRKMLPDQLKSPDEIASDLPEGYVMGPEGQPVHQDTGEPLPPPPPTPEQQLAQKELETRDKEAEAKSKKADADIKKAQADEAEAMAEIEKLKTEGATDFNNQELMDNLIGKFEQMLEDTKEDIDEKMIEMSVDILKRVRQAQSNQTRTET